MAGIGKQLMGLGFISTVWNNFKDSVLDKEDKKYRDKMKKKANKYAKQYTKNMEKEIAPGLTLKKAIEMQRKSKNKNKSMELKDIDSGVVSKNK